MYSLKELKQEIKELDDKIDETSHILGRIEIATMTAKRNSRAREYNRRKKFWQLAIDIRTDIT